MGWHGLTVFGMAVRICQRHGHGEDAKTVPPDSRTEKGDSPGTLPSWRSRGIDLDHARKISTGEISADPLSLWKCRARAARMTRPHNR